jgi:hypothetical protein
VFFWPGAIDPAADNVLALGFGGGAPLLLPATAPMGDFMLATGDAPELWGRLQKAKALTAKPKSDPKAALSFTLRRAGWVLGAPMPAKCAAEGIGGGAAHARPANRKNLAEATITCA